MPVRLVLSLLFCCLLLSCGRKPTDEFADRPPIPTAPVAIPATPDDGINDGVMRSSAHTGEDLRTPRDLRSGAADPSLSGPGPKAQTYTYVPVPSPRVLPGEKVSDLKPAPTLTPSRDPTKPTERPASAPVTVSPPLPAGAQPDQPKL